MFDPVWYLRLQPGPAKFFFTFEHLSAQMQQDAHKCFPGMLLMEENFNVMTSDRISAMVKKIIDE